MKYIKILYYHSSKDSHEAISYFDHILCVNLHPDFFNAAFYCMSTYCLFTYRLLTATKNRDHITLVLVLWATYGVL